MALPLWTNEDEAMVREVKRILEKKEGEPLYLRE